MAKKNKAGSERQRRHDWGWDAQILNPFNLSVDSGVNLGKVKPTETPSKPYSFPKDPRGKGR